MGMKVRWQVIQKDGQELVEEIHKVVVHQGRIGDCDDPEIYVAEPIWNWQQTEAGKFVMKHAVQTPSYQTHMDHLTYGYKYVIVAELEKKKLSEFYLKFGKL